MGKKIVLFDFDGVIMDSYRTAFSVGKIVCPDLSEEHYRQFFEGNIFEQFNSGDIHSESCRHEDFWNHYIPKLKQDGRIVPGMDKVIRTLAQAHNMVVVSSGQSAFIQDFLGEHELASYFVGIMGNDIHESKEEKIKMVFAEHGTDASRCVFITDTLGDIREAEKMGVGALAVTWGFHEPERLAKGSPFRLVDTPELLPEAIADYFIRV